MRPVAKTPRTMVVMLATSTDQHFDSPVALPALLGLVAALRPVLAEGAGLDLVARHADVHQRLTNGIDATLAERLIVRSAAARVRVAVDPDLGRRVLLQVRGDRGDLGRLVCPDVGLVEVEENVAERGPAH